MCRFWSSISTLMMLSDRQWKGASLHLCVVACAIRIVSRSKWTLVVLDDEWLRDGKWREVRGEVLIDFADSYM